MFSAEGVGGELRCAYAAAARLGRWALSAPNGTLDGDRRAIVIEILWRDDFLMLQRPLDLALRLGEVEWVWRSVLLDGETVHVRGGPEIVKKGEE